MTPDWDKKYRDAGGALFGDAPNEYVREIVARSDFVARDVVCLADGDGRNGRWLAGCGHTVTALDISGAATDLARSKDAQAGVHVTRIVADLKTWQPPDDVQHDAAFLIYLQADAVTRHQAVRTAAAMVRPGGWFVLEGFGVLTPSESHARSDGNPQETMGPSRPELRYDLAELEGWLADFDIIEAFVGRTRLAEGTRHQGLARCVRCILRKLKD